MAKIAFCGYGHAGQSFYRTGRAYAYVVNDNVNVGDQIQVVSTSPKENKFATTASPLTMLKENSVKGQEAKQIIEKKHGEITEAYSGSQLGVKGFRGDSAYKEQVRAQNLQAYQQTHPDATLTKNASNIVEKYGNPDGVSPRSNYQSFDEYSKNFMGDNK